MSERSRCGAVRILAVADEPSTGIGRVGSLAGEPFCGDRACRSALAVVPCPSLSSPANPLRGSGVSDRSRCGAVPILERFRRRGEGGGGERGEEGGGRREEEGGSREEGGGGRREEGGGRREEGGGRREEGGGRREEGGGRREKSTAARCCPAAICERRPAVPGLAVAQLRRRDGGIRFGRGVVGGDGRRDGGVRLGRRVVGREGRRDCGVPLGHRPAGQQRVGDGLVHLGRGVVGHQPRREGGVCVGRRVVGREGCRNCGVPLDRRFEGHQRIGDGLGPLDSPMAATMVAVTSREVIAEGRGDGVVGLLRGVRIAREAQGPVVGMLSGLVAWRLRTVLVPASRSQVLTRLVAPPRVAISARIPSMADCRVTCSRLLRSPAVAKGPAFWRRGSPRRASWRACPAW